MEAGFGRVLARAATIDELLSGTYRPLPGQKSDADLAGRRLAAWCRAAASGDWTLFAARLRRDGWSVEDVLPRLATVRSEPSAPLPAWAEDAVWVAASVRRADPEPPSAEAQVAFEQLLAPLARDAQMRLWADTDPLLRAALTDGACDDLRRDLLSQLSQLVSPALYERFAAARERGTGYGQFVAEMRATGFDRLFDDKPVLLRLMASLTRQWIDSSRELLARLAADLTAVRRDLLGSQDPSRVAAIGESLSDRHNFGRTVRVLRFVDDTRVVYKPKALEVDAAWAALVDRLNACGPPTDLRAMRVLARNGYGWTEFIDHTSCDGPQDFAQFFRRAGAWLALFQLFAAVDMHQENIVACGAHPVPVDLEMILQALDLRFGEDDATSAAMRSVVDSVVTIGMLPAYGRHSTSRIFVIGGVHSNSAPRDLLTWIEVNTDAMRPVKQTHSAATNTNLPYTDGHGGTRGALRDHLDDLTSGFADYAAFLARRPSRDLTDGFSGLQIRTVLRPTRFYGFLLQRMRDHRTMDDGAVWSAQADFVARLADWESDRDELWPLHRAERMALVDLNVPHFTTVSDGGDIRDRAGNAIPTESTPGLQRATARMRSVDVGEIDWQLEVIRQNTDVLRRKPGATLAVQPTEAPHPVSTAEADAIAAALSQRAVRRGVTAAWIGLDFLGDSEVSQLVVLGPDLYNGGCGIALFLAAHAAVTGDPTSRDLALAALTGLRGRLRGGNPARFARSVGLGAGLGLGSIVYALAVTADLLGDADLLADAHAAAELITDEVVAADRQLDVLGGSAGAILGLLRLHRQTGSAGALRLAEKCGRRLRAQDRVGEPGRRTWASGAFGRPLNGMSHGAAGFAYSLVLLSDATGDDEFAKLAAECVAFEDSTFDTDRGGWADLRETSSSERPCKWCYGAPGIGLARIAMGALGGMSRYAEDIDRALAGVEQGWPATTDTLCCGTLGSVEFLWAAADLLGRVDLRERANGWLRSVVDSARASGDYRWSSGTGRFNLGLFRGVAGIGYTVLRAVDETLPNVLVWE